MHKKEGEQNQRLSGDGREDCEKEGRKEGVRKAGIEEVGLT